MSRSTSKMAKWSISSFINRHGMKPVTKFLFSALLLTGCQRAPQGELTPEEAIELARGPADRIPGNDLSITRPVVRDGGTIWIVRFEPPEGMSGGAVQVEIDKSTRRIISAMAEQ